MKGNKHNVLLIAGVHRQEFAFGQAIVEKIKHLPIEVLLIPQGISNLAGDYLSAHYRRVHNEMYEQIKAHIKKRHTLVIDLHTGLHQTFGIDLFSDGANLNPCLLTSDLKTISPQVRVISIKENLENKSGRNLTSYTILPKKIWQNKNFLYVGMEIYLQEEGIGTFEEQQDTIKVLNYLVECHQQVHSRVINL